MIGAHKGIVTMTNERQEHGIYADHGEIQKPQKATRRFNYVPLPKSPR